MVRNIIKFFILIAFLVVVIFPLLWQVNSVVSFKQFFLNPSGFTRYFFSFFDQRIGLIFLRTVLIGIGASVLAMIIGSFLAFLFEYTNLPLKRFFLLFSISPLLIPPYIITISWMEFLGAKGNIFNFNPPFSIYNPQMASFVLALAFYPLVTLIVMLGLRNIDRSLEDAARLLYPFGKVLKKITLPLVLPHILVSGFFVFILSISEYGVPALLRVNTFSAEIFSQFVAFFDVQSAVILSTPIVLFAIFLMLLYNFWFRRGLYVTISTFSKTNKEKIKLWGRGSCLVFLLMVIVLALAVVIPISVLLIESQLSFIEAFQTAYNSILDSFWLALLGATIMVIFSFFIVYFFEKSKYMDIFVLLPIAIPSSIVGISLICFWNTKSTQFLYGSFWMIIIGYLVRFIPFTTKTLSPFFNQIHPSLKESARVAGASFSKILRKIVIPLMKPGIVISWLVGYIFCLREVGATLILTPPGFQTLPARIETLMHYGNPEMVSSLCLILAGLVLVPMGALFCLNYSRKFI